MNSLVKSDLEFVCVLFSTCRNQKYENEDYHIFDWEDTQKYEPYKWDTEIKILRSIYEAVQNNSDVAENQIGAELIEKLNRLSKNRQWENVFFEQIEPAYQKCKDILKF